MSTVRQFKMLAFMTAAVMGLAGTAWAGNAQAFIASAISKAKSPNITPLSVSAAAAYAGEQAAVQNASGDIFDWDVELPNGETGIDYWGGVMACGPGGFCGDRVESYSISGSLPDGLTYESVYDWGQYFIQIIGIPTTIGTSYFTVTAVGSDGASETKNFSITITEQQPPVITTASLPNGEGNRYYENQIRASGYNVEWRVSSGSLPTGLELGGGNCNSYDGYCYIYIDGYPVVGTYNFTIEAKNNVGVSTKAFNVTISEQQPPVITTATLPNGEIGVYYERQIQADGRGVTWSMTGNVPPGLRIYTNYDSWGNNSYTYIYGTPTATGPYTFKVIATNAAGSDDADFTVTITALQPPVITTTSLPNGEENRYYSQEINANGSNVEWRVSAGSLPAGLELGGGGGWEGSSYTYIRGYPVLGTYPSFTIEAKNDAGASTKAFNNVTITSPSSTPTRPSIQNLNVSGNGEVGVSYRGEIGAYTNGYKVNWRVAANSGSLPPGLKIDSVSGNYNYSSAYITGAPTQAGTFTFKIEAYNAGGSAVSGEITIVVTTPDAPDNIQTYNLPSSGETGVSYSGQVSAYGRGITWSVVSGNLPPGLNIDPVGIITTYWSNGDYIYDNRTDITGTPTAIGTYSFKVKASNAGGDVTSDEFTIEVTEQQPPVITTATLPNGEIGVYYERQIQADGRGVTWSMTGNVPPGLRIYTNYDSWGNNSYTYIYGTPTATGTYTFTVKAANAAGDDTREFRITITELKPPVITSTGPFNFETGVNRYAYIHADGSNITWSVVSGSLPSGLRLSGSEIYGTPTTVGSYPFTVKAQNAAGSDEKEFTIVVRGPQPEIATTELPDGGVGAYYGYAQIGAYGSNITWSLTDGELPPGLEFEGGYSDNGYSYAYISGTPTAVGTYPFTVKAENSHGIDTKQLTIEVKSFIIMATELSNVEKGGNYSQYVYASTDDVRWSVIDGNLPAWLSYDWGNDYDCNWECYYRSYIRFSGTPTTVGTFTFTVRADKDGGFDEKTFTIKVEPQSPPVIQWAETEPVGVGESYGNNIVRAYGAGITWSVVSGSLPPGLEWNSNSWSYSENYFYIYGTPTTTGTYTFKVRAANEGGHDETTILSIQVFTQYDVTFRAGGGTVSPSSAKTGVDGKLASLPTPTRSGYAFNGWYTAAENGTVIPENHVFTNDAYIYAQWSPVYSVTLNANGGTLPTTESFENGANGWVLANGSQPNKWVIGGATKNTGSYSAYISNNGTANSYNMNSSSTVHMYKDITFPVSNTDFVLTFYIKGRGGNYDYVTVSYSNPNSTPTAGDYFYAGTSLGTEYANNGNWALKTVTLPAADFSYTTMRLVFTWRNQGWGGQQPPAAIDDISITKADGVSIFSPTVVTAATGAFGRLASLPEPTKVGTDVFGGWYTALTGGEKVTESRVFAENTTIYARWTPVYTPYTVTFNANGGTVSPASGKTDYDGKLEVVLPTPAAREHYTFDGWYTAATGGTAVTASTQFSANTTIYARWTPVPYAITYFLNGGTVTPANPASYTIETETFTLTLPTKAGHTFAGWTGSNGNSLQYSVSVAKGSTGDKSYTAGWVEGEAAVYGITYNLDGGTVSPANPTSYTVVTQTFKLNNPTKTGYTFAGWTGANGTSPDTSVSVTVGSTGVKAFKANWTVNKYEVAFDSQGGGSVDKQSIEYGGKVTKPADPARADYVFGGWYKESAYEEEWDFGADAVKSDITLYAKWTPVYTITFDANGGTVSPSSGKAGESGKLASLPTPTRAGYTFDGWFTARTGGDKVTAGTVFDDNDTVYAVWKLKIVPVVLVNRSVSAANPRVGDTLTAALTDGGDGYSYAWKLGGAAIGNANRPYVVAEKDIGGRITLVVSESGETYAVKTAAVIKGAKPDKPKSAPTVERVTYSVVKLAVTAGYEYAIEAGGVKKWQESSLFNGLTPNTQYTFYQRVAETKAAYASLESLGTKETTKTRPEKSGLDKLLVKARNRPEAPEVPRVEEASVAPSSVSKLTGEFTAGPNPVVKYSGPVNFYRRGGQLTNSELRVYDVNGNVVSKVKISDLAIDNSQKRTVGSWDLRDSNGKPVSSGTYLVKGVLKTIDGKSEKVSLILGVR